MPDCRVMYASTEKVALYWSCIRLKGSNWRADSLPLSRPGELVFLQKDERSEILCYPVKNLCMYTGSSLWMVDMN